MEMSKDWMLADAEKLNKDAPDSYLIPTEKERESLSEGSYAKLVFRLMDETVGPEGDPKAERMWVKVERVTMDGYEGALDNDPQVIKSLSAGDKISFSKKNIVDIQD